MKLHPIFRRTIIVAFWIAVWQAASLIIDNSILLVGPADVLRALAALLSQPDFFRSVGRSLGKISLGFFCGFAGGVLAGSLAFRFRLLSEFLDPVVMLLKSIPVASFVILALICMGSEHLSVFISFTVVFPIIYIHTIAGLKSTDHKLLEMARVFRLRFPKKVRFLYLPALLPHLADGCRVALGMAWKSGIAAEVIGVPAHTIGENLYLSKIYLSTADLFAWTIVIILVSMMFERLALWLLDQFGKAVVKGGIR